MKRINKIGEANVGDILLSIPDKLFVSHWASVDLLMENRCYMIDLLDEDIESFTEEIGIGKIVMYDIKNNVVFVENCITHEGAWMNANTPLCNDGKTYWKY